MLAGKHVVVLVGILTVVFGLAVTVACQSPEVLTPPPGLGEEIDPQYHWRIQASEEQLQVIEQLWGKDLTVDEFLHNVCPEVAEEMPERLLKAAGEMQWPSETVRWDLSLSGGIIVTSSTSSIFGCERAPIETPNHFFYYYVGKKSMEVLPRQLQITPVREQIYYYVSIYTGS